MPEPARVAPAAAIALSVGPRQGAIALALFFGLLLILPLAAQHDGTWSQLFDAFYRSGSLVFGGHVVLPLLQAEVVPRGWVGNDAVLAGYGAAQAVPGPLFTFAAYLGAVIGGWRAAAVCLIAVFLPSFLLVVGALPFWQSLRRRAPAHAALKGAPPWSDCCWPPSMTPFLRPASVLAPISLSRSQPSCCFTCGRRRRGWSSF